MGTGGHSSDPLCSVTVCRRLGRGGGVPTASPGPSQCPWCGRLRLGICLASPVPERRRGPGVAEGREEAQQVFMCIPSCSAGIYSWTLSRWAAGPWPCPRPSQPGAPHGAPSSGSLLLGEFGVPCTPAVAGRRGRARHVVAHVARPSGGRRPRLRGRPAVLTAVPHRSGPGRRDGRAGQGRAGAAAHGGAAAAGPGGER